MGMTKHKHAIRVARLTAHGTHTTLLATVCWKVTHLKGMTKHKDAIRVARLRAHGSCDYHVVNSR
jgi:hypothetical protein